MTTIDIKQVWRDLHSAKAIKNHHIAQYILVKATKKYTAEDAVNKAISFCVHNLAKAYTPVTREIKLQNGLKKWNALESALYWCEIKYMPLLGQSADKLLTPEEIKFYIELKRKLTSKMVEEYIERKYVYIFVRQDISPEYQAVQAAHATLRLGTVLTKNGWDKAATDGLYFTLVGVPNLDALADLQLEHSMTSVPFHEPDINDQMTALCLMPLPALKRGKLLKHKWLTFKSTTNPPSLVENK